MALYGFQLLCYFTFIAILSTSISCSSTDEERKASVHIVYMGSLPEGKYLTSSYHLNILQEVVKDSMAADLLIRRYRRSFNGFAAKLTDHEKQKLSRMKGVVSVFPSRTFQLQTTRSWEFMGVSDTTKKNPNVESDVIIGVIDSGIWPESLSFTDEDFGPAPTKWKGVCKGGENFTCNNKIIGARYYMESSIGARDDAGHGSHTASTAAGNKVKDASFYGLAHGTARGGVPSSRIAAYKVCTEDGCTADAMLAAFDDAIADGVDIITVSIGARSAFDLYQDPLAIGAFHAMEKGVLTVNSAGNSGPSLGTTASVAPWMLSVAASSIDRLFIDKVVLGNGKTLVGISVNSFTLNGTKFPLVYGPNVSHECPGLASRFCSEGCVDSSLVKGKIVLCDRVRADSEAHRAGAAGAILKNDLFPNVSFVVSLPASALSDDDYSAVKAYMNSREKPYAKILKSEGINDSMAPVVAPFSSRGPNSIVLEIMKPDLAAPGVDILAAYSPMASPSGASSDDRKVKYNILSGTSMACPHAAGVAAYVKSFHPDWSPSAIKSALMTTAWPMNASKNEEVEFAYGSGHIDPVKAIDPGLVYEALKEDYINLLCSMGYDLKKIRALSGDNSTCPEGAHKASARDFNSPAMTAKVSEKKSFKIHFRRTVTNVGDENSTYKAKILSNPKINIKLEPTVLSFKSLDEKKSFNVTITASGLPSQVAVSASLVWYDGTHSVRSPIILHTIES